MNKRTLTGVGLIRHLIEREHYVYGEEIPKHGVCMIARQIYDAGLFVNCDESGRGGVYHFKTITGAMQALGEWKRNGGSTAHPPGNWRKYKSPTGELLNPMYNEKNI
jgi:hypothetical protein